jgi:hypothetical protein
MPSAVENLAIRQMNSRTVAAMPDVDLKEAWQQLDAWYREAPTDDMVNAAVFVMRECERRGLEKPESPLAQAAMAIAKSRPFELDFGALPQEQVLVPDFVSIVGSYPQGKDMPNDLDVLVRSGEDRDGYRIAVENVRLPIRKILDPDKQGLLHFYGEAQGPHGDHIPLYDLVLRRKESNQVKIIKGEGDGNGKAESVAILKADEEKRLVYSVVLRPNMIDTQDQTIDPEEVEKAAHYYLEHGRAIGYRHRKGVQGAVVESYIAPTDFMLGRGMVRKGDWVMVMRVDDPAAWNDIKSGFLVGYSVGGRGSLEPLT